MRAGYKRVAAFQQASLATRRQVWIGCAAISILPSGSIAAYAADSGQPVTIERFSPAGDSLGEVKIAKVARTDAEWRRLLTPLEYEVTRHAATEKPYTGATWNNHRRGLYRCICCDTALFSSRAKYNAHSGWPSFFIPISADNIVKRRDYSDFMVRTAVSCALCDAHLGHVFPDGPQPTGLRYCMDSAAMKFYALAA